MALHKRHDASESHAREFRVATSVNCPRGNVSVLRISIVLISIHGGKCSLRVIIMIKSRAVSDGRHVCKSIVVKLRHATLRRRDEPAAIEAWRRGHERRANCDALRTLCRCTNDWCNQFIVVCRVSHEGKMVCKRAPIRTGCNGW